MDDTRGANDPASSEALRHQYDRRYFEVNLRPFDAGRSIGRFTLFREKLKAVDLAPPRPTDCVLDLGCGRGDVSLYLAHRCRAVYGLDYAEPAIELARQLFEQYAPSIAASTRFAVGRATDLPFPDLFFDKVYCLDVVEHLSAEEQRTMLSEVRRVLRPKGCVILLTPVAGEPPWPVRVARWIRGTPRPSHAENGAGAPPSEHLHIRELGIPEMRILLRTAGFRPRIRVVTSHGQDTDPSITAARRFVRHTLFPRIFGTKMVCVGTSR